MSFITNIGLSRLYGKSRYQALFQKLYEIGISGMNYGNGAEFEESGEMEAVRYASKKLNKSEFTVFDVGANVGNYSKRIVQLLKNNKLKVYAFEPSGKIFHELKNNLAGIQSVEINNMGLGDSSSRQNLYKSETSSGLSSLYKRKLDHFDIDMNISEEVEIISLDEYCASKKIKTIDFLKMDVEGHELQVLSGAKKMLAGNHINFIQFEFGGCNIDSHTFFQDFFYLLSDQYFIYRIVKDGLVKIERYKEELEVFTTINYLAELKTN